MGGAIHMKLLDRIKCPCGAVNDFEPDVEIGQEVLLRCACGKVVKTRYFYHIVDNNKKV